MSGTLYHTNFFIEALFLEKLLEGFNAQKEEIHAIVAEFLESLPADMKHFLDFSGLKGIFA